MIKAMENSSKHGSDNESVDSSSDLNTDTGSTTQDAQGTAEREKVLKQKLIEKEEKHVRRIRLLVCLALLVSAISVSTAIYFFARGANQSDFELEVCILRIANPERL